MAYRFFSKNQYGYSLLHLFDNCQPSALSRFYDANHKQPCKKSFRRLLAAHRFGMFMYRLKGGDND